MDWSLEEVNCIVADYFSMLHDDLSHIKYNKTTHRKNLRLLLNGRSDGSIEFKHQNISAALAKMGYPYVRGYKPRANLQTLLEEEVSRYLIEHKLKLEPLFQQFADEKPKPVLLDKLDLKEMEGEIPTPIETKKQKRVYRAFKTNYLEREQNNGQLGEDGEKFVLKYEELRLKSLGRKDLADNIEWVSKEKGDGLGYDILSKNLDGSDRFIEVKTTKLSNETPFFSSSIEIDFAAEFASQFYLYRVYNFTTLPKVFVLRGNYSSFCSLEPVSYRCRITNEIQ